MEMKDMVAAVRKHAGANYERAGWDFVIECLEDEDIEEYIRKAGCSNEKEAIQAVGRYVKIWDERRQDQMGA